MTEEYIKKIDAEQKAFKASLDKETDRGCSLMAASYLDYQLENVIRAKLVNNETVVQKLFKFNGSLGSFSSKIEMAYSIGLIGEKAKKDLNLIRKIRNDFAHNYQPLSFTHKPMSDLCNQFYHDTPVKIRDAYRHNFTAAVVGVFAVIFGQHLSTEHISECNDIVIDEKMMKAIEKMKELKSK